MADVDMATAQAVLRERLSKDDVDIGGIVVKRGADLYRGPKPSARSQVILTRWRPLHRLLPVLLTKNCVGPLPLLRGYIRIMERAADLLGWFMREAWLPPEQAQAVLELWTSLLVMSKAHEIIVQHSRWMPAYFTSPEEARCGIWLRADEELPDRMAERLQYVRLSAKACAVEHEDTIPSELYEGLLDLSLPHDTRYTSGFKPITGADEARAVLKHQHEPWLTLSLQHRVLQRLVAWQPTPQDLEEAAGDAAQALAEDEAKAQQ